HWTVSTMQRIAAEPTLAGAAVRFAELAPSYRQIIFPNVSTVITAAVDDSLILANLCQARPVRGAKRGHHKVVPRPRDRVFTVRDELRAPLPLQRSVVVADGSWALGPG
ncbi:hypothetical protein, partial [Microbacterium sp.]|uniref:hypothetical protein n=1 Tax=Microbacterium sp. TaxID=51671 RepID=UPI002735374A